MKSHIHSNRDLHSNEIIFTGGTNTPLLNFSMETFKMNFNLIVNVPLRNQTIRKAYVPLIGMSGVPQVRPLLILMIVFHQKTPNLKCGRADHYHYPLLLK